MKSVNRIVDEFQILLDELKIALSSGAPKSKVKDRRHIKSSINGSKEFKGLKEILNNLMIEGFFDLPKSLSDIQSKLRDEGENKPTTSLMRPLVDLVKIKILKRIKSEKGLYEYSKRN